MNIKTMSLNDFSDYWAKRMINEDIFVWVEGDKIAGMICINQESNRCSGTVTLCSLAIHPDYHNKGLGRKMVNEILSKLKKDKIVRVQLIVEEDNDKARPFYKKLGFEEEGKLRKYFNREGKFIDEIMMARLL
jgi:ribosomal protein S18 acetylase RimI-like enzyme